MQAVAEVWSWIVATGAWLVKFERGTLAGWIAGLGSLAAAIAAVNLARQATRAKLVCWCEIENMSIKEIDALPKYIRERYEYPVQLEVSVFNAGPASAIIHDIRMQIGSGNTKEIYFLENIKAIYHDPEYGFLDYDPTDREKLQVFPVMLASGETTKWCVIVGEQDDQNNLGKELLGNFVTTEHDAKKLCFLLRSNHTRVKKIKLKREDVQSLTKWVNRDCTKESENDVNQ